MMWMYGITILMHGNWIKILILNYCLKQLLILLYICIIGFPCFSCFVSVRIKYFIKSTHEFIFLTNRLQVAQSADLMVEETVHLQPSRQVSAGNLQLQQKEHLWPGIISMVILHFESRWIDCIQGALEVLHDHPTDSHRNHPPTHKKLVGWRLKKSRFKKSDFVHELQLKELQV